MRSFCSAGAASDQAVMPGAWLVAQAKLIGISFSSDGFQVVRLRHLVQDSEGPQQQRMYAECIETADVKAQQRFALAVRQFIAFRKLCRRREEGIAAIRLSVHITDQFLQRVNAHYCSLDYVPTCRSAGGKRTLIVGEIEVFFR